MPADPFKELLEQAFTTARDTGKPVWNRMLVAVLRNRILQLTNRSFKTQDFGAKSLLDLVARYPDLVKIDLTVKPVVIEWIGPLTAPGTRACRIRPDLWRAILDLSSGLQYEWDVAAGHARAVNEADPRRRLPMVDGTVLATWRLAFVAAHESLLSDPVDQAKLQNWLAKSLGRQGLPGALRVHWNDFLKREVVARLTSWFQDTGLEVPDLFGAPIAGAIDTSTNAKTQQPRERLLRAVGGR